MASLSTLQTNVAALSGLDNTASNDQPRITSWLNDAVLDMLRRTHCYVKPDTLTLTANSGDYTLDTAILTITTAYTTSAGTSYRFQEIGPTELVDLRVNVQAAAADPAAYFAVQGANLLMLYPTPASAGTITIYYVPRPTALSGASDDPSSATLGGIPSEFHHGLELYALWQAGVYLDDQGSGEGMRFKQEYMEYIRDMKAQLKRKGGFIRPRAKVGRRRSAWLRHDNSIYSSNG